MPTPSKGKRAASTVRMPLPLADAVDRSAKRHHMVKSDYIAAVLARHEGMADVVPQINDPKTPQELPMTG